MMILGAHFAKPIYLSVAAIIPVVYLLGLFFERRRRARLEEFARQSLWQRIIPELDWTKGRRKFLVWCLALFFFLVAAARPQWGEKEEIVRTTGLDVMLVFDVSKSMDTEDVVPSRLKKAKRSLRGLLDRIQGDRAGLILYAGSAHLTAPLTTDLAYLQQLVDEASPLSVSNQGTDIGSALEVAVRALDRGAEQIRKENPDAPTTRAIVLVSDGEDHEKQVNEGTSKVADADLKLYVLGIGTEKGAPIPMRDETGQNFGYKRDKKGETVVSRADFTALRRLADQAKGRYWTLTDSELEIDELVADLGSLARGELDERRVAVKEERFQIFVAIGIFFLLIELSLGLRREIFSNGKGNGKAATLGLLLGLVSSVAQASTAPNLKTYRENEAAIRAFQEDRVPEAKQAFGRAQVEAPHSPDLSYNQGVVQLREGKLDEAIQGLERASRQASESGDYGLSARALYNQGIANTQKKDKNAAAQSYLRALEENKKAPDADLEGRIRKNLELLSQKNQGQDQDQQKQDQDQKNDPNQDQQQKNDQNQSGKNQNSGQDEKKDQKDPGKDQEKKDEKSGQDDKKNQKKKKPQFKSEKLSSEDADRVMSELARRERELQQKLQKQKGRPQSLEKDW